MKCEYCERETMFLTRDHIIPKSRGGHSFGRYNNTAYICGTCNTFKGSLLPYIFIEALERKISHKKFKPVATYTMDEIQKIIKNLTRILKERCVYSSDIQEDFSNLSLLQELTKKSIIKHGKY